MGKQLLSIYIFACIFLWSLIIPSMSHALTVHDINIIKISPSDNRAVIKISGIDKLQIIAPGDELSTDIKVIEIEKERVVFNVKGNPCPEKVILWWRNGKQQIETISRCSGNMPVYHKLNRIPDAKE